MPLPKNPSSTCSLLNLGCVRIGGVRFFRIGGVRFFSSMRNEVSHKCMINQILTITNLKNIYLFLKKVEDKF